MAYRYESSVDYSEMVEEATAPDIVYYNGDIINNATDTYLPKSQSTFDPQIRFNETRDVAILKDASLYNFSIVRFTMNGCGKDLPLFIPQIQTNPIINNALDVNRTVYSCNIQASLNYADSTGTPRTIKVNSTDVLPANQQDYGVPVIYQPETEDPTLAPIPLTSTISAGQQDLSTRYYWVYTYGYWLRLVNAMFAQAMANIQTQFNTLWTTPIANGGWGRIAPAPTLQTQAPYMSYNPSNGLFSLYADAYGFGYSEGSVLATPPSTMPSTQTPIGTSQANVVAGAVGREAYRLYFNQNLFGLFTNFKNTYQRQTWGTGYQAYNEIFIGNYLYQNVVSTPVLAPPALGDPVPTPASQKSYWLMVQDYESTSTLWSPVASIVFTSGFLPIVNEATGAPIRFGTTNLGISSATVPSAFQPIITDVALANQSASDYRGFINYTPTAEYRITSFQRGKNEVRQIDIQ
ncbi:hypothetical protein EB077_08860, partial [bacterium]|nr:hypothetical protein [bacterium]